MPRTTAFVYILSFVFIAACGSKDEKPASEQRAAIESNFQGGECGARVVRDYRAVAFRCDRGQMRVRENGRACRREAEDFLAKYPTVDCVAKRRHDRGPAHGDRDFRIEAREIREILERLERLGF